MSAPKIPDARSRRRGERTDALTEKRLRRAIREHGDDPDWSNRRIARAVGVDEKTVRTRKLALVAAFEPTVDSALDVDEVPTVLVTTTVEFVGVQGFPKRAFSRVTSDQFTDAIRDRDLDGLRDALTQVAGQVLRDPVTVSLWNRQLPRLSQGQGAHR